MGLNDRHAVIGFPRWTHELTFSGGDWLASYPVANLGALPLSHVARSAGLAAAQTRFVATLARTRPIRMLAFVRHNLSRTATIRIKLYSDAAGTHLLHDQILDAWPVVYPASQLEWESDSWWDGRYSEDEMAGYAWTRPVWLPQLLLVRRIDVDIADPSNSDGHVDIGLFEVAQGWQVGVNFDYGAEYGFEFRTTSRRAIGGSVYSTRLPKPRVFRGTIPDLPREEALARAFEHQRRMDVDVPFLWMPDPGDPLNWLRTVFLARNASPGLLAYAAPLADGVPLSFEEVIDA